MNVLEKILEEIKEMRDIMKSTVATNCFGKECEHDDCTVCVCERAMEIIRSHMDNVPDTNVGQWIPTSERLPNEEEFVQAYCRNHYCAEFIVMIYNKQRTQASDTVRRLQRWVNMRAIFENVNRFEDYKRNYI